MISFKELHKSAIANSSVCDDEYELWLTLRHSGHDFIKFEEMKNQNKQQIKQNKQQITQNKQ